MAIPKDKSLPGLIMEGADYRPAQQTERLARKMAITGMEYRDRAVEEVMSISIEHRVECVGAVVAAAVLWWTCDESRAGFEMAASMGVRR